MQRKSKNESIILRDELGETFEKLASQAIAEQNSTEQMISKETMQAIHKVLMNNESYHNAIKTKVAHPDEIVRLIESILILYKHDLDSLANIDCLCREPFYSLNISGALLAFKTTGLEITRERRDAVVENAEYAFALTDPLHVMAENDKYDTAGQPILTKENEKAIYQHAKLAEDIGSALSYLGTTESLIITQPMFNAVIAMAKAGLLSRANSPIQYDKPINPYEHILKNLELIAADPRNAENMASALIRLHQYRLLDSRYYPVNAREFILAVAAVDPGQVKAAAKLIIKLRQAMILDQDNLDKLLKHPDKIVIILKNFHPREKDKKDDQFMLDSIIDTLDKKEMKQMFWDQTGIRASGSTGPGAEHKPKLK